MFAASAYAQDGGLTFDALLAQSFEFSDNPDLIEDPTGTTLRSRTDLRFGLESETANQSLRLDFGAGVRFDIATSSQEPSREGVVDPFVRLRYDTSSQTSRLNLVIGYSQSDVGDLRFVSDGNRNDIVIDDGDVERTDLSFGFETGIGTRLGSEFGLNYSRRVYTETTDPSLNDDESLGAFARLRFGVSSVTDFSLVARYARDQEFEGSDYERETKRIGFGIDHELTEASRVNFELTSDRIDTFENGLRELEEGYSIILGYGQDLPDGGFRVDATSILENIGNRNSLTFSRDFDLPDGELELLFGLTNNDTSELFPLVRVVYARDLRDARISTRLEQNVNQDISSDDEFRNRIFTIDYTQDINSVSSWATSLGLFDSANLTDGTDDQRADFEVSYRRQITRDWDVVSGYRFEEARSSTDSRRRANTLFVTFERPFVGRP